MAFLKKAREVITGKTNIERLQEKAAQKEIKKATLGARYKTQKEEAVKYAMESEKHKYSEKLKRLKQPRVGMGSGGFGDYGGLMGKPRFVKSPVQQISKKRKGSKKKGSKKKHAPVQKLQGQLPPAPKRFDVLSGRWI